MNIQKGVSTLSTEDNKATARRVFEEVWNLGNLALVDEFYSPDYVFHTPSGPVHGPEGMKQRVLMFRTASPDLHYTIEDMIAEGDKVVVRWTSRGTHLGPFMGIPPTGKQVTMTGIIIGRFEGGKIVEGWTNYDMLGALQQLDVIPAPGQATR